MTDITIATVPKQSALYPWVAVADFCDAWEAPLHGGSPTPTEIFLCTVRSTPGWVGLLMSIRNRAVRLIGLKDVGAMENITNKDADDYLPGDRIGIFSIIAKTENELLLGIDDHHLDVRVSVFKNPLRGTQTYIVSTVVRVHNALGRAYMVPVGRIHPIVVRAMMRRTSRTDGWRT